MKILLLNDNSAHPNWGAQATPAALRWILEERIPGCEIKTISWSWIRTDLRAPKAWPFRSLRMRLDVIPHFAYVIGKLTRPVEIYPRVRDDFDWFEEQWTSGAMGEIPRRFIELAEWSDVLVYNGENNLYRNTPEGCRSLFLAHLVKTRIGKPVCSINHTVHITGVRPVMKAMVETVLPELDLVTSREPRSYRLLQELGATNAKSGADVVFALEERTEAASRVAAWLKANSLNGRPFACLSASGLPLSRPREGHDGAFAALTRELERKLRMPVVLVARDPALQFLSEVARRTGAVFFGPEHHYSELWPLFRNASVLVTGHFHYAIVAAMSGCPFVPLSVVNHKMQGLCEQLGWERVEPFDVTWLSPVTQTICNEALDYAERGDELRATLIERSAELKRLAMETGDWIMDAVERSGGHSPEEVHVS